MVLATCMECGGIGHQKELRVDRYGRRYFSVEDFTCKYCRGTGKVKRYVYERDHERPCNN